MLQVQSRKSDERKRLFKDWKVVSALNELAQLDRTLYDVIFSELGEIIESIEVRDLDYGVKEIVFNLNELGRRYIEVAKKVEEILREVSDFREIFQGLMSIGIATVWEVRTIGELRLAIKRKIIDEQVEDKRWRVILTSVLLGKSLPLYDYLDFAIKVPHYHYYNYNFAQESYPQIGNYLLAKEVIENGLESTREKMRAYILKSLRAFFELITTGLIRFGSPLDWHSQGKLKNGMALVYSYKEVWCLDKPDKKVKAIIKGYSLGYEYGGFRETASEEMLRVITFKFLSGDETLEKKVEELNRLAREVAREHAKKFRFVLERIADVETFIKNEELKEKCKARLTVKANPKVMKKLDYARFRGYYY